MDKKVYETNILAYRMLTLGEMKLMTATEAALTTDLPTNVVSHFQDGKYNGYVLTLNDVLEEVKVLDMGLMELGEFDDVLTVKVQVGGDNGKRCSLEFLIGEEMETNGTKHLQLQVIELD